MALLTSIGFGVVSAVIPIVNAEAYIIASQMSAVAGPISIAIGIAIGQTIGKLLLFFGVREGKELSFVKHRRQMRKQRPIGPTRARIRAAGVKLLDLVGQERWGLPIVLAAAVIGIHRAAVDLPGEASRRLCFARVCLRTESRSADWRLAPAPAWDLCQRH